MSGRVLVTGSRNWADDWAVGAALTAAIEDLGNPDNVVIVHGACPTGADAIADEWAASFGYSREPHPADWTRHGRAAGPIRNQKMVDLGADICVAFPEGESRGTRDCMKRALAAGILVRTIGVVN